MNNLTITRRALAALGFCAAVVVAAPAGAVVRYELQSQTFSTTRPEFFAGVGVPTRPIPLTFTVVILLGGMSLLLIYADIVKPITIL